MTMDPEQLEWLTEQTGRVLTAAIDRDAKGASDAVAEAADRYGHTGVYSLCCALAETVRQLVFPTVHGDGSLTGEILALVKLPGATPDRHTEWACRFITTHVNGDGATNATLFFHNLHDTGNLVVKGVAALILIVGDVARHAERKPG